jgi:hypothetical protein
MRGFSIPIVPIRLGLGFVFLGAARVLGVETGASVRLFGLGAFLYVVAMLTSRRRRLFWHRAAEATQIDAGAPVGGWAWTIARSTFPSTLGVAALTAVALQTNAPLAALLAGVLAGMGVGGLVFAVELVRWERARNGRLLSTTGLKTELYIVREAEGATGAAPPARAS